MAFLKKIHFYASSQIERISNVFINGIFSRKYYDLPILVRPTPPDCTEEDWLIEGVDAREKANWHITEICFD